MRPYDAVDFLDLDRDLTEEERMIRKMVRDFVDEEVMPIIDRHFEAGTFPEHLPRRLGELGLLGTKFDGYGSTDLGAVGYGLICQELERCDSGIRSFASAQSSLVMYPIHAFGSDEQKERWLPRLASGEAVGCFGLTEHDYGSNPGGMITVAKRDGKDFVLNGAKMWITNGNIADVAVVWAKLDGKVRGFLVERGMPGYETNLIRQKFSLRASVTSELVFQNVRIPAENYLPGSEIGLKAPLMCLNEARYGIAWGALGAASACYDEALRYAKNRVQFARPIAGYQLVQEKLVTMLTDITLGQLLCLRLGRLKDAGASTFYQVSFAKRNNVRMALETARTTRDILGAAGICYDFQCGRHMCNLESVITYEGTHDIHTLIVGERITGIPAYS